MTRKKLKVFERRDTGCDYIVLDHVYIEAPHHVKVRIKINFTSNTS